MRVVAHITLIDGAVDVIANQLFDDFSEAMGLVEELRSTIPELGSVVDWTIRLKISGSPALTWSMDDDQGAYEHRILIRDNMDAAHYQGFMRYASRSLK